MNATTPLRILLIEDEPNDSLLVENALREKGLPCQSRRVDNEPDFLVHLEQFHPDLILSDHGLAHFSGDKALSVARQKRPEIPFIFFTSSHNEREAIQAFKNGAVDYVLKTRLSELVPAVQRALAQAEESARRRQAEENLRRSEESFRLLVENVKDYALYRLDAEGRVASWNTGAERIEGYLAEEIVGRHFSFFFTPEDIRAGKPERILVAAAREGRVEDSGWRVRKDGSRFWAQVVCTAIRDRDGRLTGFTKVARDMTEQKRAEEKLKAHSYQQAAVAELGQKALLASDLLTLMDEAVTLVAQTCAADFSVLLEWQPNRNLLVLRAGVGWNDSIGRDASIEATPETHAGYALGSDQAVLFEDLSQEQRFKGAAFLQEHGVKSGLNVIIRQHERPFGVLGIYTRQQRAFTPEDIHFVQGVANVLSAAIQVGRSQEQLRHFNRELERRVAHRTAQLAAANAELESFSYSVSHDLRTPLRHIGGFVEMLNRTAEDKWSQQSRSLLAIIADSAKKMDKLINDLLTLSRLAGTEMRLTRINMSNLVEKIRADLEAETQGRRVRWQLAPLPECPGDPVLLRQVWTNLISNALKYTRTRTEALIEIGAREEDHEWVFWIRDNGVGFDPQYGKKLFGVFQRLHPNREFEGTGIGLAIVRRLVARHGGRTWAESKLDQGATFYFSLPKAGVNDP